jgi:hypothetical protein
VTFFDTYVGAGVEAHAQGLIHRDGVHRIVEKALEELVMIVFENEAHAQARRAELERDIERAG